MRIIIEPEKGEKQKKIIYENVVQFSLCGELIRKKIAPAFFRQNVINEVNILIGMVESLKEDLKDFKVSKNGNRKSTN